MQSCGGQPNFFIDKIWFGFAVSQKFSEPLARAYFYLYGKKFGTEWDLPLQNDERDPRPKLHTIRRGHRWKAGMKIHAVIHNRTANRFQFAPTFQCLSVQDIIIQHTGHSPNYPLVMVHNGKNLMNPLGYQEMEKLARNDGFDSIDHFFEYFNEDFEGQIIHWTPFLKY